MFIQIHVDRKKGQILSFVYLLVKNRIYFLNPIIKMSYFDDDLNI